MPGKTLEYDIIIIGGGPAGSTAGYMLSNFGYKALIIDKHVFPREKLCGGLITYKGIKLVKRIFNESENDLIEKGIINFTSNEYEFRFHERTIFNEVTDVSLYLVDREVYDNFLLNKAKEAGADLILGDKVTGYDKDLCEVNTSSGKKIRGKFIVGADGINSLVRKSYPRNLFNWRKWRRNLGTAFEIFVKRDEIRNNSLKDMRKLSITLGLVDWGFAWIFPRKDRLAIGIGGIVEKSRGKMREAFYNYLKQIGIDNPYKYKLKAHNIQLGGYVTKPVYKNVVLVGEAGGYVDPTLGEGIFYAQRTAELASWAIHMNISEDRPLDKVYRKLLWKYVLPELANAKFMRLPGFYISEKLGHYPLQGWMNMFPVLHQEMLHGIRSNRGFFKRSVHENVKLNRLSTFLTRPPKKK